MKNTFFTLLAIVALLASPTQAQDKARDVIHERISTEYKESYTIVSVDTVAMPIRMTMSLDFAMTLDGGKAVERFEYAMKLQDPALQAVAIKKLATDMENNLKTLITTDDIVAMRNSNAPHSDDYYNYQRTVVYLEESRREEIFYIRLGEESISMTRLEYDRLEAQAFLKYWNYRDLMKKLKEISKMY